jgi:hypothetical protein
VQAVSWSSQATRPATSRQVTIRGPAGCAAHGTRVCAHLNYDGGLRVAESLEQLCHGWVYPAVHIRRSRWFIARKPDPVITEIEVVPFLSGSAGGFRGSAGGFRGSAVSFRGILVTLGYILCSPVHACLGKAVGQGPHRLLAGGAPEVLARESAAPLAIPSWWQLGRRPSPRPPWYMVSAEF